jgi:4-amino-4-deoxy-L-arabinose transferase-like glycosyltransferase
MAISLCIGFFIFIFWAFYLTATGKEGMRSAFIKASITLGTTVAVITELLSAFKLFRFDYLFVIWLALCIVTGYWCLVLNKDYKKIKAQPASLFRKLVKNFRSLEPIENICLMSTGALLCITLTTALLSPPNNLDSMSYHMPRVMHWIQNATVAHYPTNNLRQISFPPGAEYIVANFVLLAGNDYFANMVQWMSYLGCILGTSLIAAEFTGRKGQITAAIFCAAIPMAILQATTTQTDLTVSFWLICSTYFVFRTINYNLTDLIWISLSFSLAVLTKPTAFFFGLPIGTALIWRYARSLLQERRLSFVFVKTLAVACGVIIGSLLLSSPNYVRNYQTFDSFLGPDSGTRCKSIGLKPLLSNLTRNVALSLPLPDYWRWVGTLHETVLELDVDDPRTTFENNAFSKSPEWLFLLPDEDFAGNPLHFLLIVSAAVTIIFRRSVGSDPNLNKLLLLLFIVIGGVLIFNLLIKWQIWGNRLFLVAYILLAPVTGSIIAQSRRLIIILLVFVLLAQGTVCSLFAVRHPLIPLQVFTSPIFNADSILKTDRERLYFNGNFEYMHNPLKELKDKIHSDNCRTLGIKLDRPEFEYALWAVINKNRRDLVEIKHIDVDNPSKSLPEEFSNDGLCAIASVEMEKVKYTKLH